MKKSELQQLIKEEIDNIMNTKDDGASGYGEVMRKLTDKMTGGRIPDLSIKNTMRPEKTYIFSYIDAWGGSEENEEFWSVEVKASSEEEAKEKALEKARNSPDTRGFVGRFTLDPNTKWPRSEEPEQ